VKVKQKWQPNGANVAVQHSETLQQHRNKTTINPHFLDMQRMDFWNQSSTHAFQIFKHAFTN
jgi:hypothetical protein